MSKSEVSEQALLDDFFRQGDAFSVTAATLEPPMGLGSDSSSECDSLGSFTLRTVEQEARRRKFARQISVAMTVLALGTAVAVVGHLGLHPRATAATPEGVSGFGEAARVPLLTEPNAPDADPRLLAVRAPAVTGQELNAASATGLEVVTRAAVVTASPSVPELSDAGAAEASMESGPSAGKASAGTNPTTAKGTASPSVRNARSRSAHRSAAPTASERFRGTKNVGSGAVQSVSTATARARSTDYRPPTASFAD